MDDLTCVHSRRGLCEDCQREYDASPWDWLAFGAHPAGIARWARERAMMDVEACERIVEDEVKLGRQQRDAFDEIPF